VFSLRNALIMVLVLIATGLGVWIASAAYNNPTVVYTIDEKEPASFPTAFPTPAATPFDDDCPVGAPCKVWSDLNVTDDGLAIPAVTSISPTVFQGPGGTSIPNGTVVGKTHVVYYLNPFYPSGTCSSSFPSVKMEDTKNFLDGGLKGEVADDPSDAALQATDKWPTQLENDNRVQYLLNTTGHKLLRRSVAVLAGGTSVNLLSFDVSDGNGFASLTQRGIYNVAVTRNPIVNVAASCTPFTSNTLLLGQTAAGLGLLRCYMPGTHTMTSVLTHDAGGNVVVDNTVNDNVVCSAGVVFVGGLAEFDPLPPETAADGTGSSAPGMPLLAGLAAAGALLLAGGAWYARRRWVS